MRRWIWISLIGWMTAVGCAGDDDAGGLPADMPGTGGQSTSGTGGGHVAGTGGAGSAGSHAGTGGKGSAGGGGAGTGGAAAGSGGAPHDPGTGGADAVVDAGAVGGNSMRLSIAMKAVPGGGEDHVCVTLPLANTGTIWVKSIHATLTTGSHHLIVDRYPVGSQTNAQATPCSPTMGGDSTRLIIAQQRDTQLDMPDGTALRIEAQQPIFMQLHYINLAEGPADIEGVIELELADATASPPIEVQSVFSGALSIQIPKHEVGASEFFLNPGGSAQKPLRVFALTSHTHSLGIEATIERVPDIAAPAATPLHTSLDWHEPPLTRLDPPLEFTGSDGLRLRCKYMNTTDVDVHFGTRFEDEMCFMWLYYYEAP